MSEAGRTQLAALDIGLNLMGGDPLGFWRQPEEVQVDLLAYHRIARDRRCSARYGLLTPMRFDDHLSLELLKLKKLDMVDHLAGGGSSSQRDVAGMAQLRGRMVEAGQDPAKVDAWLASAAVTEG